ncbi:MAG: 2,3,4,5-tetrahydropyridine-2,6-dicarboxylate N-succinyltransferase [Deltaproteobacteria bacterium]|nr:MAG: 2,3,4,5-tetrahydropyridine-2,6-dicarboxylate N-succinyltransferase [Deltaproteobacteria bacterium]
MSDQYAGLRARIEAAFADRSLLADAAHREAVIETIGLLDRGELRVATPPGGADDANDDDAGDWTVHVWVKQAVLLYFGVQQMETIEVGPYEYHDKIPLKRGLAEAGVRVVPPGVARHGAHLCRGVVLMPGYVNIGAWVGEGTMVDTWATVGSCAQIGAHVHLSGGVGIGGVLEPPGATPVIIEDGAFIGSRAIVVEGVRVGREAVLGANVVLTASTKIIDVTGDEPVFSTGYIPPRSVVIPGTRIKQFPAGEFGIPAALIIGHRNENTDKKVSLNAALRDHGVAV